MKEKAKNFYTPIYISNGVYYYHEEYVDSNKDKYPLDSVILL